MKAFLCSLLVVACLSLELWARPVVPTPGLPGRAETKASGGGVPAMPKQCKPGKTSAEILSWRWKPDTRVRVYYLKGNFNAGEASAFSRAVNNWNKALREIDSRVVFAAVGERDGIVEDNASITVLRGVPKGKDRLGQLKFYSMSNGVMRATLIISPVVTDLDALTSLMAHELGHSLGLADCYECRRGTTAMSAFKGENKGNDVYEPSECDKYSVAVGYAADVDTQARAVFAGQR